MITKRIIKVNILHYKKHILTYTKKLILDTIQTTLTNTCLIINKNININLKTYIYIYDKVNKSLAKT